ncbi:PTS glucose transporter subunit IIBC [Parablautia intestinalis]|jgi:PTS system N-acetylglucosamine-specific IIC component|uniref:PTS glucose transporter subunit IIBC n=2 Tax=Parablautia intestinalis TaxID=2320100 RepID=A0A3A9ADL9_9FIRM|nr:PTS transporter subunit EIIC [Lachnospiraceae bacterium]RKI89497.1 PTS glucose transporter subunit IIBC [Parablautia intestinalis]
MMKYLQKLGKALMLPVACLPICGILMGLGYALCKQTMQGGEITGFVNLLGFFLVKAGGALIDNMALLFVIGVGVGMADDHDGTAGLASLAAWLMITNLLSVGVVTTLIPSIAEDANRTLAFSAIANPFIGILSGIIGATCYNKFKSTKLPDWLSFFSGKRCVTIISGVISIVVAAILLVVWPIVYGILLAIGQGIVSLDAVGAGIYAFLNRLLIPTGLHHALNNVFWFDTVGLGDLKHFWAGETSADVTWSLGMYMSGFFPCMMFGIPGAALAMIHTAKDNKKKVAIGLVASAAVCAFVCGVTEPFEFGFMFLAPGLYLIYALLYGIFTVITTLLGFRAGFSFSAGATDLVFSASLPAAQNTWMIIPLGLAAFAVFYVVFRFAIVKFDLKTPGREDDDLEAEKKAVLSNNDFTEVASIILEGLGGKGNIVALDNCITRLRLEIKDYTQVDEKKIKSAGVAGIIRPSKNAVQVIVGTKVQFVADEMKKML